MTDSKLEGYTILFVGSGSEKKEFTLKAAKKLGLKIVLLNSSLNWQKKYVDYFIKANTYNHQECLDKLDGFMKRHSIDGAITFWEDDVPLLAKICEKFDFVGPSVDTALKARNKFEMRTAFKKKNMNTPKFFLISDRQDLEKAMTKIKFPAVIKPCWGSDSEFVIKIEERDDAANTYEYVVKNATPKFNPIFNYNNSQFILEEYLSGSEYNIETLVQQGIPRAIAISDKMKMKAPYFIETGDVMPTSLDAKMREKVEKEVYKAIRAIGLRNGITHTEVKLVDNKPMVIEIAARMGGDYLWDWVKNVWTVDLVEQSLLIALGKKITAKKSTKPKCYMAGKYIIPQSSGIVSGIQGIKEITEMPGVYELKIFQNLGEAILIPPEGFETLGWIVTKGKTEEDSEAILMEALMKFDYSIIEFAPYSSIGQSRRKDKFSSAQVLRKNILGQQKIEKIRMFRAEDLLKLHIGVLCNEYEGESNNPVEQDLTSVGKNIQKTLEKAGYKVTFFDMNKFPDMIADVVSAKVDVMFNVCERINNSSLLEPHSAALLDMLQIPYTGSNPHTLSLCIDKIRVKELLSLNKIPTPAWDYVFTMEDSIDQDLEYPLIVKPANTDNSIGITNDSVVQDKKELYGQLEKVICEIGRPALIEEYIEGDEFDISIMGNEDDLKVLPLSQSMFEDMPEGYWHIYPYDAKWGLKKSVYDKIRTERPAGIPKRLTSLITEMAIDTYNILDCHDYGRVEIRTDREGNPYVLELNPNPSINIGDCVPACAETVGFNYKQFLELIIKNAIKRYKTHPPYYHLMTSTMKK
ncbi:MAG: hypothetical protein COT15_04355 [Candidatus Diapherotrites archaeon CG08_land_8_20_14_0_20_34_12]|nr:MAG: hypothetical protein COT15_04355 [Candidatus Diapherotrites archaeon CG08_land_8_20_14_0_20_34_12]